MLRKRLSALTLIGICASAVCAQQGAIASNPVQASPETQTPTSVDGVPTCESKALPDKVYRVGGGVEPPKPITMPQAEFSNEARALLKKQHIKKFEGVSIVEMTVDAAGMPQDTCIRKQAGYGLDKQAFVAAGKYRFQPATLNGKPVAVRLAVEVKFRRF
jgi:Gram-negative bacterial TonB protein C-terminal